MLQSAALLDLNSLPLHFKFRLLCDYNLTLHNSHSINNADAECIFLFFYALSALFYIYYLKLLEIMHSQTFQHLNIMLNLELKILLIN